MVRLGLKKSIFVFSALIGMAAPAAAQVPSVGFVFPPGGRQGSTVDVQLGGGNLQGATAVLVSGSGVSAQIKQNGEAGALPLQLAIAPDAVPGLRELRVVTPRGTSNAGRVWVGSYPELNEAEPNNTLAAPQKLESLPITVNGQVNGGEDVDCFTFQAGAGETWVFDLVAFRMASALDGYLSLHDHRGKVLASTLEGFDRDPRLIHTFKEAGTYTLLVRDTLFRGGGNFVYKLTLGKIPFVTGYLPLGGRRGQKVTVNLTGVNLGEMRSTVVEIPMDREEVEVPLKLPDGAWMPPISLLASDIHEIVEIEPNDEPRLAVNLPSGPLVVNGRIDKPGERDYFRLKPEAAGSVTLDVHARRIGSRLDSFLRVLDAEGKEIQANDDAVGKDSRITLNVEAGKEYVVEVRSLDQSAGEDVFYRMVISPAQAPDFQLSILPDSINVPQRGSASVTVNVARLNGFGGPVEVRLEGLPAGVTPSPIVIPAGAAAAQFTLTAAEGAEPGKPSHVRVIGKGTIGERVVERVAQPEETYQRPLAPPDQPSRRRTEFSLSTVMPAQAYALDIEPKAVTVKRGEKAEIKIRVHRQEGQNGAINIAVAGQPANVNPAINNVPEGGTEVVLTLNVAGNAPVVTQNVIITGNLSNNVQTAPALTLTITE